MTSREYWQQREEAQRKQNITDEAVYQKELSRIYADMLDSIQKEIDSFYAKYAGKEGITLAEAKRRVSQLDIDAYARKAERYVREKNFSDRANEEMRLYNLTMKVNRLELLKANLGLELVGSFDELQRYFEQTLTDRTLDEFQRQAGILGESMPDPAKAAQAIVNASFHNATFSDRIWLYQDLLRGELDKQLQRGLIQGKGSRELARDLRKRFDVSRSDAERLMTTELRRVQTEAAKQSYERNGNEEYEFLAVNPKGPCPICKALDGKRFPVKDLMPGKNAPPMHPRCHCATAPYWDEEEFQRWLEEENRKLHERMGTVAKTADSGIMKLPKYKEAVLPDAKFSQYALNSEKDANKARAFQKALGYNLSNYEDLIRNIKEHLPEYEATPKGNRGYGMTYEVILELEGPNGKKAKVLTGWIDDANSGEMRLTTVHVDD